MGILSDAGISAADFGKAVQAINHASTSHGDLGQTVNVIDKTNGDIYNAINVFKGAILNSRNAILGAVQANASGTPDQIADAVVAALAGGK